LKLDTLLILLDKVKAGTANEKEIAILESWYIQLDSETNQESLQNIDLIQFEIKQSIDEKLFGAETKTNAIIISFTAWKIAASLILVSGLLLTTYFYWRSQLIVNSITYSEYYSPKGKIKTVTLPDGSKVTLNADSKLKIVKGFEGNERTAYLEGEAFFEVTKNKEKPFVVHTGQIETKVLGTSFDINAYPENPEIEVSVLEGKVSVSDTMQHQVFLSPHQKSVFQQQNLTITEFKNINDAIGWKERKLIFKNESWNSIAHKLERYYNVNVSLADSLNQSCRLNASFDNEQLDNVLKILSGYTGSSFKKKGARIFIKNKDC
jgi:transmembrane sensor